MPEETVSQRLKILIRALGLNPRSFSGKYNVNESTTRGYIDRGSIPNADYVAALIRSVEHLNPLWLLLGEGEMFLPGSGEAKEPLIIYQKNKGNSIGTNHGTATQNSYTLADCEKERDAYKAERDLAQKEVVLLRDQLAMKDALIAAKEEMLVLLRGSHNRPN